MADEPRQIHVHLSPAGEVYHEKLRLRRRADLPARLIELPGFTFTAPARGFDDEAKASTTLFRGFCQTMGAVLQDFYRGHATSFVTLVRLSAEGGKLVLAMHCPRQNVVAGIQAIWADPVRRAGLAEEVEALTFDYKVMVPPSVYVPVVFAFTPATRTLLAMNQNHLENPEYFLDPDQADSTSGLLNLIGTLLLLDGTLGANDALQKLFDSAERHMDNRHDEWLRWLFSVGRTSRLLQSRDILVDPERPEDYYVIG